MKRLGIFTRHIGLVAGAAGKATSVLGSGGRFLSAAVLLVLMLYVTADVCSRFFFGAPFKGTLEMSQMGLAIVIFLSIAYTQAAKGHVRMELFTGRLSPRTQAGFGTVYSLVGMGLFVLIVECGIAFALRDWRNGVVTDQLHVTTLPARLAIPVGASLMFLQLLVDFFKHLQQLVRGER